MFLFPVSSGLKELSLDLTDNKLTSKAFNNFTYYLANLKSDQLVKAELLVRANRIEESGAMDIARSFKRFGSLQSIKLDAYFNNLKTKGVKSLALLLS